MSQICHDLHSYKRVKLLKKQSRSGASFWKIIFKRKNALQINVAFLKLFENNHHLLHEIKVYTKIVQQLLESQICPHFLKVYGTSTQCKIPKFHKSINKNKKYNFILMQFVAQSVINIQQFIKKFINQQAFWNICFQIAYTCCCMARHNLLHNDLHSGNIFCVYSFLPKQAIYVFDHKKYQLKTNWFVLIYDFDRSKINNTIISNMDFIYWLGNIYNHVNPSYRNKILKLITSKPDIQIKVHRCFSQKKSLSQEILHTCNKMEDIVHKLGQKISTVIAKNKQQLLIDQGKYYQTSL
jgi:hypothetical protein